MFNKIRYSADEIYDLKSVICDMLVSMMSGNVLRRSGHILTYVFPAHFTLRTIFPFFLYGVGHSPFHHHGPPSYNMKRVLTVQNFKFSL